MDKALKSSGFKDLSLLINEYPRRRVVHKRTAWGIRPQESVVYPQDVYRKREKKKTVISSSIRESWPEAP